MKSRIKWKKLVEDQSNYSTLKPPTVNFFGESPGCDFYLNIYSFEDGWCWSVRSKKRCANMFANGMQRCKTQREAEIQCAKWAVIYFLRLIHPSIVKGEPKDGSSIYWFQPIDK
jgi:hypothetical protein